MKLSTDDAAVLERLADGSATVDELADGTARDPAGLADRLAEMESNGLVRDRDGEYALTESGRQAIAAPGDGSADSRIDVPPAIQTAIDALDLRADRAEALEDAVAFLRYWGSATDVEIQDAIFSEDPAGYGSVESWWAELVRPRLAALPDVEAPDADGDGWRYAGARPDVDLREPDGRLVFDSYGPFGSAKHAIEALDATAAERAAVRAAFAQLFERRKVTADELVAAVYPEHPAGYDSADEWLTACVEPAFERLPKVEREADDGAWRYTRAVGDGAGVATDGGGACPVCGDAYSGRVFILASETVLAAWPNRTCVSASVEDGDSALTIFYHAAI